MSWVFVALVTKECHYCNLLLENWTVIINSLSSLQLSYPNPVDETKSYLAPPIFVKHNHIHSSYPSSLMRYLKRHVIEQWYPMILLINRQEWDTNTINNLIIMNSLKTNDKYTLSIRYDTRVIGQFKKWVEDITNLETPLPLNKKIVCQNQLNLISFY